jgi:hypothetical protein
MSCLKLTTDEKVIWKVIELVLVVSFALKPDRQLQPPQWRLDLADHGLHREPSDVASLGYLTAITNVSLLARCLNVKGL